MASWTAHAIHFLDFEGNLRSGILEYGLVTLRDGRVEAARTRLCQPKGRIKPEDTAVHGLDEAALAGQAPFSADWELFASLREQGPLGAHYASAENSLIKSVWPYPRSSPDFSRPGEQTADWGPWVDSAALCAELLPRAGTGKLEELVRVLDLQGELDRLAEQFCPADRTHYHAALYDALAGALLLTGLAKDPLVAELSLSQLLVRSTRTGSARDALQQGSLF